MTTTTNNARETTAAVGQSPATSNARSRGRARRKVVHLYSRHVARVATAVGLPTPYLCGRSSKKPVRHEQHPDIEVVGGLMPVTEPSFCQQCVRVAERLYADQWDRLHGSGRAAHQ